MINKRILIWFVLAGMISTGIYWVAGSKFTRPFFPIGLFGVEDTAMFSELKAAGFNCLVTYRKEQEFLERWTEEAGKAGLKVIVPPLSPSPQPSPLKGEGDQRKPYPLGREGDQREPPSLKGEGARVKAGGGNILAWYLADEPDIHGIRPEQIRLPNPPLEKEGIKDRIPTAICVGRGQAAALYRDVCDIIMIDWYPVPHLPLESVREHVSEAVAASNPGQPVWAIIQAFPWSVFSNKAKVDKSGRYNRPPTYEEMNKMVQFAINAGASGILFYTFQGNGWKITDDPAHWDNVKRVTHDISFDLSIQGKIPLKSPFYKGGERKINWMKVMGTGLITTLLLTPLTKLLGRKFGLTDRPDGNLKNHIGHIPVTGGMAILLGIFAAIITAPGKSGNYTTTTPNELGNYMAAISIGGAMLFILGFIDDSRKNGINPFAKITVEIAAGIIAVVYGIRLHLLSWSPADILATIAVIVVMCNAVNLLDGIDGLAGAVIAISSLFLFILAISKQQVFAATLALAVSGASLGFLAYNLPPASVFMGNSGSLALGFGTAVAAILIASTQNSVNGSLAPLMAAGVPIVEMSITITRRLIRRSSVFTGDRRHVYDLLAKTRLGNAGTVFTYFCMTIMLGGLAIWLS